VETFDGARGRTSSRGKPRMVARRIRLEHLPQPDKPAAYASSARALLSDQIAYIRSRRHCRRVTEQNGRDALAIAEQATELASQRRQ